MTVIYTIGHSLHAASRFVALLHTHHIKRIVDVRSQPFSKRAVHFYRSALEKLLLGSGVEYAFAGEQLGGRPSDRTVYRQDGTVDYGRRGAQTDFKEAIARLVEISQSDRTAILCAEEDPAACHRRLLVAPALLRAGSAVVHIRGDGRLEAEHLEAASMQLDLFGGGDRR